MTLPENVVPALAEALSKRGYETLTPVQEAVLAPDLQGADMLVSAQTGSGKTVAFGLALAPDLIGDATRLARAETPLALIVAPTRELALQVRREFEWLYAHTGALIASCVGGMDMRTERRVLDRGAHIVVGTPGRLRDHIERGSFDTSGLHAVVLDEADEMLDLGFREDLEYILDTAPAERRTLMFSATVPRQIATLAKTYQRNAVRVSTAAEREQHVDIDYRALTVAPNDRENAIINVLRFFEAKNALVFCGTRATVNHMTSRLTNRGFSVVALSGELSQNERSNALQSMRDGRARVCVATDVAARGIDLPDLELVIHADLPRNRETLLHRSGRTGRAGRKGVCSLIVPYNARRRTEQLLRGAGVDATWENPPSADDVLKRDDERMLADPALTEPVQETELDFARTLLAQHDPEKIAAALVRLWRSGRSAPEELLNAPTTRPEKTRDREPFGPSVWFSLSVGRNEQAEARWLLPMLCRYGHLTKRNIGAIRVQQDETLVELSKDCVDAFLAELGPNRMMEKSIRVTQLDRKPPQADERPAPRRNDTPGAGRVPRHLTKPGKRGPAPDTGTGERPKTHRDDRTEGKAPRPAWTPDADGPPKGKGKPKAKKPFKAKPGAKEKPGMARPKRKTPKPKD